MAKPAAFHKSRTLNPADQAICQWLIKNRIELTTETMLYTANAFMNLKTPSYMLGPIQAYELKRIKNLVDQWYVNGEVISES